MAAAVDGGLKPTVPLAGVEGGRDERALHLSGVTAAGLAEIPKSLAALLAGS